MQIAYVAYKRLDDSVKDKVDTLLKLISHATTKRMPATLHVPRSHLPPRGWPTCLTQP